MVKLLSILLLAAGFLAAQTLEGVVTDVVSSAGIPGVRVALSQGDKTPYVAVTDSEGRFRFSELREGDYSVRYSATRYFSPSVPGDTLQVRIRAGGLPVRIERRMIPLSRIAGRVIDGSGDPVAKARVELTTGSAFWQAETDAKGNFDMPSVIPAALPYTLSVAPPLAGKPPAPDPDTHEPRAWVRSFYPNAGFEEQAIPIALHAGEDLPGLELKLLAAPVHAVRGVLLNPNGDPVAKVAVALWEPGPRRNAFVQAVSNPDGVFELPSVPDGEWRLSAESDRALAEQWITIKGRDLSALKLRLTPPFTVSGKVIVETREGMPVPVPPRVTLIKQHNGKILLQGQSIVEADGATDGGFRFELYPGSYRVIPGPPPPGFYVESVRAGETPVLEELELSAGSPGLTIVYKSNGGTVRGAVEKCGTGQVWLIPQQGPPPRNYFAACNTEGRFEFTAVRPGDYYAVAVPGYELWPGGVNAAILQRAARLTVRPNETTGLDLTLSALR
uniref:Cna B domain protein n=1 Tax=Solibacter usitatus (strain Ellin6076) TaxID=234267 RepID=Q020K2_SOLUE